MNTERLRAMMVTFSIMLATIIQVVDTTIANVALPHMQGALGAGAEQITWVLTSYIVATAIMTLPVGYLAQRFGRRLVFLWSVAGFSTSSMLCGQADTLNEMVFWRLMQGLSGAALVPLSQATLLDTFPPAKLASAMSIWGMGVMLGPVLGPTLGGWLTDSYSWRWVFLINVPLGLTAFTGIYLFMPENKNRKPKRFDGRGFAFLAIAIGCLQLMLDRGEQIDWFESLEIQLYTVLTLLGLYLFVVHSMTTNNRFLSPGLFRDRNFVSGVVFIFIVGMVVLATMALLPPFLQQWKGYPAATTGLILMPRGVGTMAAMLAVSHLLKSLDSRMIIMFGMLLVTLSLHYMAGFTLEVSQRDLVITGVVQGVGLGLVLVPISALAYVTLDPALRDEATGLFSLSRNLGSSIGVSLVMSALSRNMWINQQELGARLSPSADILLGLQNPSQIMGLVSSLSTEVNRQAAEIAYINDFHLLTLVNLAAMPLVLLLSTSADSKAALAGIEQE